VPGDALDAGHLEAVAHGYLTLSLFIPVFTELLDVEGVITKVSYGLNKVRFPSPVKAGSRVRLVTRPAEVEDVAGGVQSSISRGVSTASRPSTRR
jgi:acyl dehydratase